MACSNAITFVILPHILLDSYEKSTNHNGVGASPCVRPVPDERCLLAGGRTQGDAPTPLRKTMGTQVEFYLRQTLQ
jgi:hypothetical protein